MGTSDRGSMPTDLSVSANEVRPESTPAVTNPTRFC
jgi:hypothetical protein